MFALQTPGISASLDDFSVGQILDHNFCITEREVDLLLKVESFEVFKGLKKKKFNFSSVLSDPFEISMLSLRKRR